MISHEQNLDYLAFAEKVLDVEIDPDKTVWLTKLHADGSISAVVVYRNFSTKNCEMLIASDGKCNWASREFMGVCYRYAFNQMNLARVTVIVDKENPRSLKVCHKIGYIIEGILKKWFGDRDAVAMRMLREECRWLGGNCG